MFVCICHGITDGHIGRAVGQGCASVGDVFRHVGERPQCGRCVPELCRLVRALRPEAPMQSAGLAAEAAD